MPGIRKQLGTKLVAELGTMATGGKARLTSRCVGVQDWLWEPCSQADMGKNIPVLQKLLLLGSASLL